MEKRNIERGGQMVLLASLGFMAACAPISEQIKNEDIITPEFEVPFELKENLYLNELTDYERNIIGKDFVIKNLDGIQLKSIYLAYLDHGALGQERYAYIWAKWKVSKVEGKEDYEDLFDFERAVLGLEMGFDLNQLDGKQIVKVCQFYLEEANKCDSYSWKKEVFGAFYERIRYLIKCWKDKVKKEEASIEDEGNFLEDNTESSDLENEVEDLDVISEEKRSFNIGESIVEVIKYSKPGKNVLYFNMHDNENDAVMAAKANVDSYGGFLVELKHEKGGRLIHFGVEGVEYRFDPNRMFFKKGIERDLRWWGRRSPQATKEIEAFRSELLNFLSFDDFEAVVAVHNNKDGGACDSALYFSEYASGDDSLCLDAIGEGFIDKKCPGGYSVSSYLSKYRNEVRNVCLHKSQDVDDFFFLTDEADFNFLKAKGYNVVLQDNKKVKDDGSLSFYCADKGKRYINVEVEHGKKDEQIEMISVLQDLLR